MTPDPERVAEVLALLQSADKRWLRSGGLRSAATTGYCLPAFQAEEDALLREVVPPSLPARVPGGQRPTRYREVVLTSLERCRRARRVEWVVAARVHGELRSPP